MAYVYIVRCRDGSLYTGITTDIRRRMREHYYRKKSGAKYTKSRRVESLEMVWETEEWADAAKLEWRIKRLHRQQKEELIRKPYRVNEISSFRGNAAFFRPLPGLTLAECLTEMPKEGKRMDDRLSRQISFLLEIDKQKEIIRQTYLASGSRRESDAEHAWHMAVMCVLLSEYANEPIDVPRTVMMLLTHDLVEIDAGDTYAYDVQGNATKRERELKAADRIYGLLPADQAIYLRELWDEFEAMETPEAKFANMLDKIQPVLLNDSSGGKSWTEHGVRESQIMGRNARTHEGSEILWDYIRGLIEKNVRAGFIKGEEP